MKKMSRVLSSFLLAFGCFCLLSVPAFSQIDPDPGEEPGDEDIAGVWKASEGVLYTTAEDQDGVLGALGAQPDGEGWTAKTYRVDGREAVASFKVQLVDAALLPALFFSPGDVVPCPHPNHVVYRNSTCGYLWPGWSGLCQVNAGNLSQRTTYNTYRSCRRQVGPTYCVNVRSIIGWTQYFYSGNCTGAVYNQVSHYGWTCH